MSMTKFSCPKCGCNKFTMMRRTYTTVDFGQEGAIEGHPFISNAGGGFDRFLCYGCKEEVPAELAERMLKEVM